MELKITVSEADFGAELKDILNSLSIEEKKEIAKEVLLKSLNEVTDSQRTLREKEEGVFPKIIDSLYHNHDKEKYNTPEMLRTHYKYKELMGSTKSAKELAVEEIIKSATSTFRELSTKMVQEDAKLKELWDASSAQIQEDFPKYIHSAMTYYFASKLSEMQQGIQSALFESQNASFGLQNIKSRIGM